MFSSDCKFLAMVLMIVEPVSEKPYRIRPTGIPAQLRICSWAQRPRPWWFFCAEKMRKVKVLDRTSRMLVHISVYIEDVYMNVKIHMIHSIYILANDCICNMHISRYLHTPLHKHNCIHAYLEAICPLIWGSNPCFFPIKKKVIWIPWIAGIRISYTYKLRSTDI